MCPNGTWQELKYTNNKAQHVVNDAQIFMQSLNLSIYIIFNMCHKSKFYIVLF